MNTEAARSKAEAITATMLDCIVRDFPKDQGVFLSLLDSMGMRLWTYLTLFEYFGLKGTARFTFLYYKSSPHEEALGLYAADRGLGLEAHLLGFVAVLALATWRGEPLKECEALVEALSRPGACEEACRHLHVEALSFFDLVPAGQITCEPVSVHGDFLGGVHFGDTDSDEYDL